VSSGGVEQVDTLASATVVSNGGLEEIFDGVAAGTKVLSGGQLTVRDQGTASAAVIEAGASATVFGGGVAAAARLSGGTLTVSAVGQLSGGLTLEAGKVVFWGAMSASQTVKFTGSAGTLELDNLAGFNARISGFTKSGQKIDLRGFAFGAGETRTWTQNGTSGTLTVHDGGQTAALVLLGTYHTGDFELSTDGHGGTFVKDPGPAAHLIEAMAGLLGGRAGASAPVVAGSVSVTAPLLAQPA
jgi:autotransporter passenger strand-loop-strand repeat protein